MVARINEKLVLNRLPYSIQREIWELKIGREVERLNRIGNNLIVQAATIENLVREGFHRSNECVAKKQGISVCAIENQRAGIMKKLQLNAFANLVRSAARNGIIEA